MNPEELANAHWSYVESVLIAHGVTMEIITQCGFHYRTAMIHGFKHGVEYERHRSYNEMIETGGSSSVVETLGENNEIY